MKNKKSNITFQILCCEWLKLKKLYVKHSSFNKYENLINLYLVPYFSYYSMYKMNDQVIIDFFTFNSQEKQLSTSTLKSMRYVLKSILEFSEKKYNTPHFSFDFYRLPKVKEKCLVLSPREKKYIDQHCFHNFDTISICVLLGLYAGLRIGEICALQWTDIDLDNGIIEINKTVQRLKKEGKSESKTDLFITPPKTNTSQRIVPIPIFLKDYFICYQNANKSFDSLNYITTNSHRLYDPRTIQYQFKKICLRYNININFHALRHSYATNCIMYGVDVKSLSEILGHANISTTLNLYVHSSIEFKMSQVSKIATPHFS